MTKMNGINLPDMTEQNLTVDDIIFNENFISKRKKTQFDDYEKIADIDSNGNNDNEEVKTPQNLKRKSKGYDSGYDIDKIVQSNIIIDKESNKIRLELRHPTNESNGNIPNLTAARSANQNHHYRKNDDLRLVTGDEKITDAEFAINGDEGRDNVSMQIASCKF